MWGGISSRKFMIGKENLNSIPTKKGRQAIQTMREKSFQINGAKLFNSLPSKIRNIKRDLDEFKVALDGYLGTIPDQPRMGSLVPAATDQLTGRQSNSLLAWTHTI